MIPFCLFLSIKPLWSFNKRVYRPHYRLIRLSYVAIRSGVKTPLSNSAFRILPSKDKTAALERFVAQVTYGTFNYEPVLLIFGPNVILHKRVWKLEVITPGPALSYRASIRYMRFYWRYRYCWNESRPTAHR